MPDGRRVAVIVPARNEAARIGSVLRAASGCSLVDEVIVVDDGSVDDTSRIASAYPGVRVVRLDVNRGKAGAMVAGAKATRARVLTFIDADLRGLRSDHIDRIVRPVLLDQCDMCLGVFRGGNGWSDAAQRVLPNLSGQRAIKRELFEAVPRVGELGMGIEIALTQVAKKQKARVLRVVLRGVSNCFKEQKLGLVKGAAARLRMYGEITQAVIKTRKRRQRNRHAPWRWRDRA